MQVHPSVFRVFQVIVLIAVVAIVGIILYVLVTADVGPVATDVTRKAEVTRMHTTAQTYFSRVQYYSGVCDASGATAAETCNEGENGYAIAAALADGTFYCADSTGFRGVLAEPLGTNIRCNQ